LPAALFATLGANFEAALFATIGDNFAAALFATLGANFEAALFATLGANFEAALFATLRANFEAALLETTGLAVVVLLAMRAFLVAVMLLISDFFSMLIWFSISVAEFFDLDALTAGSLVCPALSAIPICKSHAKPHSAQNAGRLPVSLNHFSKIQELFFMGGAVFSARVLPQG
jgi:hypothetical protein